jgi:hypothetical protein
VRLHVRADGLQLVARGRVHEQKRHALLGELLLQPRQRGREPLAHRATCPGQRDDERLAGFIVADFARLAGDVREREVGHEPAHARVAGLHHHRAFAWRWFHRHDRAGGGQRVEAAAPRGQRVERLAGLLGSDAPVAVRVEQVELLRARQLVAGQLAVAVLVERAEELLATTAAGAGGVALLRSGAGEQGAQQQQQGQRELSHAASDAAARRALQAISSRRRFRFATPPVCGSKVRSH